MTFGFEFHILMFLSSPTLWANSADDKLMISEPMISFSFCFLKKKIGFDLRDNLHEMSKPFSGKNKKKIKLSSGDFTQHAQRKVSSVNYDSEAWSPNYLCPIIGGIKTNLNSTMLKVPAQPDFTVEV